MAYDPYPMFVLGKTAKQVHPEAVHSDLLHALIGIVTEAGELLDIVKKAMLKSKPVDYDHVKAELGDLRFYYQMALNTMALTDEAIKEGNTTKLNLRFKEGFTPDEAQAKVDKVTTGEPE